MEKEPESKTEDKAEAAGPEDGKVKEDFNAAEAISAPAVTSEYTVDEKVRVEYIPQGNRKVVIFENILSNLSFL